MTNPLAPQVAVVAALLGRFSLNTEPELAFARDQLATAIRLAQTNTAAYNIPLDQQFPDGVGFETIAVYVNPVNVAASLLTLSNAAGRFGFTSIDVPADLQVYNANAWQLLAGTLLPPVPVNITALPPQAPPAPAPAPVQAPPPAPAPVPAPAPTAAPTDLAALVSSALGEQAQAAPVAAAPAIQHAVAPSTVAHTPIAATPGPAYPYPTAEQLKAAFPGGVQTEAALTAFNQMRLGEIPLAVYAEPVGQTVPAPAPAPVSPAQHLAGEAPLVASAVVAEAAVTMPAPRGDDRMPDASVTAGRTGSSGRPQKSPFEGKIIERKAVAAAPFWWNHLRYSAKHVLAVNPSQALDPSSTGAGPVQSYLMLVTLLQDVFKPLDPNTTVAEIRTFLREVETGALGIDSAKAAFQLVEAFFGDIEPAKDE